MFLFFSDAVEFLSKREKYRFQCENGFINRLIKKICAVLFASLRHPFHLSFVSTKCFLSSSSLESLSSGGGGRDKNIIKRYLSFHTFWSHLKSQQSGEANWILYFSFCRQFCRNESWLISGLPLFVLSIAVKRCFKWIIHVRNSPEKRQMRKGNN